MPVSTKPDLSAGTLDIAAATELGVVNLFVFDEQSGAIRDLLNPDVIVAPLASGMTAGYGTEGSVINCNGSSGAKNIALPASMQTSTGSNLVVIARIKAAAAQSANPGQAFGFSSSLGSNPSFGVGFDNSNPPKAGLTYLTNSGAGTVAYSQSALNTWVTVAAQVSSMTAFSSSGGNYAWIDGVPATNGQGSLGVGAGSNTMNELVFGGQHRSSGYLRWLNGAIEWAAVIAVPQTPMPDDWHWQLYADDFPYNLFVQDEEIVVAAGSGANVTCSVGEQSNDGLSANVSVSTNVAASLAEIADAGQSSSISVSTDISASVGEITNVGNAAEIALSTNVSCAAGTIGDTGQTASISVSTNIAASSAAISDAGLSASITLPIDVTCSVGLINCAGSQASVQSATNISCSTAEITDAGLSADIAVTIDIDCSTAEISSAGLASNVSVSTEIAASHAEITDAGNSASITSGQNIICSSAQIQNAGLTAVISTPTTIDCATASIADIGLLASVSQPTSVTCVPAGLTCAGLEAGISVSTNVICGPAQIANHGITASISNANFICAATVSDAAAYSMALTDSFLYKMVLNQSARFTMTTTEQS